MRANEMTPLARSSATRKGGRTASGSPTRVVPPRPEKEGIRRHGRMEPMTAAPFLSSLRRAAPGGAAIDEMQALAQRVYEDVMAHAETDGTR